MAERHRVVALWLAWFVPFAVYALSLNGAVAYWDTGEMQVVPWILGIAHPTGFPAYVVIGWIFVHAVPLASVAWRASLLSALSLSVAAWAIARICTTLFDRPWVAGGVAIAFAFGEVAWSRATRAEVHTMAAAFALLALAAAVQWYRNPRPVSLYASALCCGLGVATHPIVALFAPALAVLAFARVRAMRPGVVALAAACALAPLTLYAYLPLRSAAVVAQHLDPTAALGVPPGRPFWNTNDPRTRAGFLREVTGSDFEAGSAFARIFDPATYRRALPNFADVLLAQATPLAVVLGIAGLVLLARRERGLALALATAFVLPVAFALAYSIEADHDRYYLIAFAVLWIASAYAIVRVVSDWPIARTPAAIALAVTVGAELIANRGLFAQPRSSGARSVITAVQRNTPPDAILVAPWIYATPLAYGAYVEKSLDGRIVETGWLADDAAYVPGWMKTRPVYVVGIVFGSVPGYRLQAIPSSPVLYRVVKE